MRSAPAWGHPCSEIAWISGGASHRALELARLPPTLIGIPVRRLDSNEHRSNEIRSPLMTELERPPWEFELDLLIVIGRRPRRWWRGQLVGCSVSSPSIEGLCNRGAQLPRIDPLAGGHQRHVVEVLRARVGPVTRERVRMQLLREVSLEWIDAQARRLHAMNASRSSAITTSGSLIIGSPMPTSSKRHLDREAAPLVDGPFARNRWMPSIHGHFKTQEVQQIESTSLLKPPE